MDLRPWLRLLCRAAVYLWVFMLVEFRVLLPLLTPLRLRPGDPPQATLAWLFVIAAIDLAFLIMAEAALREVLFQRLRWGRRRPFPPPGAPQDPLATIRYYLGFALWVGALDMASLLVLNFTDLPWGPRAESLVVPLLFVVYPVWKEVHQADHGGPS